jgi:thiamine pyrophosphate-dependent acetolactate synthase large subunit-like protein
MPWTPAALPILCCPTKCRLAYAELCGATGIKAVRREHLDASMTRLLATDGPAMLHIEQDPELL